MSLHNMKREGRGRRSGFGILKRIAFFTLVFFVVTVALTILGNVLLSSAALSTISVEKLRQFRFIGYGVQIVVIFVLWLSWPHILRKAAEKEFITLDAKDILLAKRHKWTGVLIAFELILLLSAIPH